MLNAPGELFEELARAAGHRWTHTEELLALILEHLDALLIVTQWAWGDPKKLSRRPPKPYRYTRPIERGPQAHRRSTVDEIRRFFRGR